MTEETGAAAIDAAAPSPAPAEESRGSPLSPRNLLALFLAPSRFFSNPAWLAKRPELLWVGWLMGIIYTDDKLATRLMKEDLGARNNPGWEQFGPWIADSWPHFWMFVLAVGVLNGALLWYIGGWWYRKRLNWSGAPDADPMLARHVYVYQGFTANLPALLILLLHTVLFSSYREAWNTEEYWSSAILVFMFWSCVTSYKGASAAFTLTPWKARLWFLVLPILLLFVALGGVAALYAFAGNA